MHTLTGKRVAKFARDFGFDGDESDQFERYVAANYLFPYVRDDVRQIERSVLGGASDEGIDIAAVVVNGQLVFEPSEIDYLIADQTSNSVRIIFIQAKTSESYEAYAKLVFCRVKKMSPRTALKASRKVRSGRR
ncbi:hypothetical protein [Rathayibacter tritici]|uniref:hypothetical protein n=1 Tax=Rathayibacter tritici TaxID=33888 RepID=UPI0011B0ACFB|nr:hypothetical protein [Rathayibacter tritici]